MLNSPSQASTVREVHHGLPDVQAGLRKGRGIRDQIANIHWITEKAREFQKNIYFCFIDYSKAFDCVDHNTEGRKVYLRPAICDKARQKQQSEWRSRPEGP